MKITKSLTALANDVIAVAREHHPNPLEWRQWNGKSGPTGGFLIYEKKALGFWATLFGGSPKDPEPLFWISMSDHTISAPRECLKCAKEIATYLEKETGAEVSIRLES